MIIALVVIILVLVLPNVRIVPQQAVYVIERLGKYQASWEAGIHVKIPILDRIVKKISLKEQVLDFPPQPVITKDNVTMRIDSVVFAKVFDPKLYTYGVEDPIFGLQNLSATTLRNIIGDMELDQTLTSRDEINGRLQTILDEATDAWGAEGYPRGAEEHHSAKGNRRRHDHSDESRAGKKTDGAGSPGAPGIRGIPCGR